MSVVYLACPYSHPDPAIKELRHAIVNLYAYELMSQEIFVFSPLTHNVPLVQLGMANNWNTWKKYDHLMLSKCDRLLVLKMPGWEESPGVTSEIEYARELGLPIDWLDVSKDKIDAVSKDLFALR